MGATLTECGVCRGFGRFLARSVLLGWLAVVVSGCCAVDPDPDLKDYGRPLADGAAALLPLGPGDTAPDLRDSFRERDQILPALERSVGWLRTEHSQKFFPMEGVDHDRALRSVQRFGELLGESSDAASFAAAIDREFVWLKSAGYDGRGGGVLFTGYCTPILSGSLAQTSEFRYPLYGLPDDLIKGEDGAILGQQTDAGLRDYPTRKVIEASHMLANRNLELIWLRDPLDAFLAHVNGSAFVRLPDGSMRKFGYSGKNGREYRSLGKALVRDGKLPAENVSLAAIRKWGQSNPGELSRYLQVNDSYVFFLPIEGNPRGSLNVEVEPERSLATDKTLFPRAGMVFVDVPATNSLPEGFQQLMFDQDTGGAIRTAGRADIYFGSGNYAELSAGAMKAPGQMYYLFLKR